MISIDTAIFLIILIVSSTVWIVSLYNRILRIKNINRKRNMNGHGKEDNKDQSSTGSVDSPSAANPNTGKSPSQSLGNPFTPYNQAALNVENNFRQMDSITIILPPKEEVPETNIPLVGWKVLGLSNPMGRLMSTSAPHHEAVFWPVREEFTMKCYRYVSGGGRTRSGYQENFSHKVPADSCNCGIHSTIKLSDCVTYLGNQVELRALVQLNLVGEIVVNDTGYRSEKAYPKNIFIFDNNERLAARVSALYGVPVTIITMDDVYDWCTIQMLNPELT